MPPSATRSMIFDTACAFRNVRQYVYPKDARMPRKKNGQCFMTVFP